ncbi:hypothetical protein GCM10010497_14440 [Streptomyces cinereoruber]|uniref:Uncharacterized protein n=1 Tax=Streptomyces cinereoruber TaxID=67260 RepID=A0AAV4KEL5_9ACTN|nr:MULTISPECIES: hypothetical protein [Streptomyces]MBB4162150.1 hypothetical protein [Streptomyces cinereoruber]MBY8819378.1 hypothetical protein [Streptomyces cinereoruber]NIH63882.1 hypothetical protein [Streptomyces cinereoruber]PVC76672.1 hypothetical protein DBP18_07690 [Streptomyces sp. CS081A]QEV37187.1 hypothetical protein CP977_33385 [Streptomyces cinereoruber]
MTSRVYTVGHSTRTFDEMTSMLQKNTIIHALLVAGAEVVHIMSATVTKPASLNECAHVDDAHITYPAPCGS